MCDVADTRDLPAVQIAEGIMMQQIFECSDTQLIAQQFATLWAYPFEVFNGSIEYGACGTDSYWFRTKIVKARAAGNSDLQEKDSTAAWVWCSFRYFAAPIAKSMKDNAVQRLRIIGFVEGVSMLVLLFIAMPLKYIANQPRAVQVVGWAHGILFMLFMAAVLVVYIRHRWPFKMLIYATLAAFLPFGTFVFDRRLRKEEERGATSRS